MVSVADLLIDNRLPGNYFASDVYVRGTLELGLLENRRGDRLLAIPEPLIKGIYAGLDQETGQAAQLVLFNCGLWWGKNFYARFCEELTDYYHQPMAELSMAEFVQAFQQCWQTHGWGRINLDAHYRPQGFLVVEGRNSAFAPHAPKMDQPVCYLETGILQMFFSQLTGRDLACVQISCESLGHDCNRYLLGLEKRLKPVKAMVEASQSYEAIMASLTGEG